MHPLVRDLYKRVLFVGRDYPTGLAHVKEVWKKALRNPDNCPSCYNATSSGSLLLIENENNNDNNDVTTATRMSKKEQQHDDACQEEIIMAVSRGRHMVKEMIGVIKLKKYRTMKKRYYHDPAKDENNHNMDELRRAIHQLELRRAIHQLEESHASTNPDKSSS